MGRLGSDDSRIRDVVNGSDRLPSYVASRYTYYTCIYVRSLPFPGQAAEPCVRPDRYMYDNSLHT